MWAVNSHEQRYIAEELGVYRRRLEAARNDLDPTLDEAGQPAHPLALRMVQDGVGAAHLPRVRDILRREERSRSCPDPKCASLKETNDRGQSTAVSYAYQLKCPNDQNLIAVMGRANGKGKDPAQPRPDRSRRPRSPS